jgi:hypothetical protein
MLPSSAIWGGGASSASPGHRDPSHRGCLPQRSWPQAWLDGGRCAVPTRAPQRDAPRSRPPCRARTGPPARLSATDALHVLRPARLGGDRDDPYVRDRAQPPRHRHGLVACDRGDEPRADQQIGASVHHVAAPRVRVASFPTSTVRSGSSGAVSSADSHRTRASATSPIGRGTPSSTIRPQGTTLYGTCHLAPSAAAIFVSRVWRNRFMAPGCVVSVPGQHLQQVHDAIGTSVELEMAFGAWTTSVGSAPRMVICYRPRSAAASRLLEDA